MRDSVKPADAARLFGVARSSVYNWLADYHTGGDRALGQVDDSLRHAITKLAHVHFPATKQSAKRIIRLGVPGGAGRAAAIR